MGRLHLSFSICICHMSVYIYTHDMYVYVCMYVCIDITRLYVLRIPWIHIYIQTCNHVCLSFRSTQTRIHAPYLSNCGVLHASVIVEFGCACTCTSVHVCEYVMRVGMYLFEFFVVQLPIVRVS